MRNIPTAHVDVDRQPSYVRGRLGSQMRCMRVLGLVSGGCVSSWSLESYVARGAEENDVGMCALLARCPVCSLYAASGVIQPESCWCVHILLVRKDCGISFVSFRLPVRNVGDSQAGWHCFVSRVLLFFSSIFRPRLCMRDDEHNTEVQIRDILPTNCYTKFRPRTRHSSLLTRCLCLRPWPPRIELVYRTRALWCSTRFQEASISPWKPSYKRA